MGNATMTEYILPGAIFAFFTLLFGVHARITESRIQLAETRLKDHDERLGRCEAARDRLAEANLALEREKLDLMRQLIDALANGGKTE